MEMTGMKARGNISVIDKNPFFLAVRLSRTIDQIRGQSEERRALLNVLAYSAHGLLGPKEIIRKKIKKERGMRALDPEHSNDIVDVLDVYVKMVETRMHLVGNLITFLDLMNNAKAASLRTKYNEIMNDFHDKMDMTRFIKKMYSGKPMPIQTIIKLWDSYGEQWKAIADYGTELDDFTKRVLDVAAAQIKAFILEMRPDAKNSAAAILDNQKPMEKLLLADPLDSIN